MVDHSNLNGIWYIIYYKQQILVDIAKQNLLKQVGLGMNIILLGIIVRFNKELSMKLISMALKLKRLLVLIHLHIIH